MDINHMQIVAAINELVSHGKQKKRLKDGTEISLSGYTSNDTIDFG